MAHFSTPFYHATTTPRYISSKPLSNGPKRVLGQRMEILGMESAAVDWSMILSHTAMLASSYF